MSGAPRDPSDTRTRPVPPSEAVSSPQRALTLTVLGHAQASRIGERATFPEIDRSPVTLSRSAPSFHPPQGGVPRPLSDPFLSRSPLVWLVRRDGALYLRRERVDMLVRVDGADLVDSVTIPTSKLERGVILELGGRCALLAHLTEVVEGPDPPRFGLVGDSDAIQRLRRDIARMGATDMRVLLRGETGSGKELAARALHAASARAGQSFVAVNMGAVAPSLAASALFGHVRGAFTGAVADHDGFFAAAHGGTLFLDEIGDTNAEVQAMLLRTLETGEVQRLGDRRSRKVDVRLLCATDADLERAVAEGRFREPLLHRIGELTLRIPTLRARRDDIGRLVVHFLHDVLRPDEQARLLDGQLEAKPWLSASVLSRLARAPWTGNVRQLRNVVRQMVVLCRDQPAMAIGPEIEPTLADPTSEKDEPTGPPNEGARLSLAEDGSAAASPPRGMGKRPQDLTEKEILDALAKTGWRRARAADRLGIARSSLYEILADNPRLRRPSELTREQLEDALDRHGRDLASAAAELQMSAHGLKLRLHALGVSLRPGKST